jgi:hypothetical protein
MAKKYKIDTRNLKKRIEEFIKYTFLNYNDEIFYREVIAMEKKVQGTSNLALTLFKKRISRLKPSTERTNLLAKTANENLNSNNIAQSILNFNFDDIEEVKEEEDNEEDDFGEANFIFESNNISNSLINSLFAFKKATNDYSPEFQKWEIYDWLTSEDDFYMEPIKSFFESYNELESENKLSIVHFRQFCKTCKDLENSVIVDKHQNSLNKILKANREMDEIFYSYFLNNDKAEEFCDKIKEKIDLMCKIYKDIFSEQNNSIEDEISINLMNNNYKDKKIFQLCLFKLGVLDNLYKVYYQFQKNNYLSKFLPFKKEEELVNSIFEFLSLISEDNIIISFILFSNQSLDLFLSLNTKYSHLNSRIKFTELKYYLKWLKDFSHKNTKLNLIVFSNKLKELYSYLEDLLTKNIGDKTFKLTQEQEKLGLSAGKTVRNTFAKILMKVKNEDKSDTKSEKTVRTRHDAGKMKEEKMKLKKIEMLNKKIMDKLKSEGECYFNLDINFTSDDLLEKLIYIVICLKKCCKLSTSKSILILNNIILDIIYKLYKSPFYYQIWEKYRKSFNESLIDEGGERFGISTKEIMNQKLNDYTQASLIDTSMKITEKEHGLVINIYKLLYVIDDYSFYLITDEIPKFEIKSLLQDKINSMGFADRKTLSSVYMRYYFISPFNILSNLNRINMNSMTKLPDCNINGAIISTSKEELSKENQVLLSNTTYVRKKTAAKFELFLSNEQGKQIVKEKRNAGQDRAFKFLKRYRIVEQALGLEPLFTNLTKYRKLTQRFMEKDILPKPNLFLKYFKNIILYPTVYSLYKLLYFTPVMTLHYKYYIYKITFLFLQCLKYFFETLLENNDRFLKDEKYKSIFVNMFFTEAERSKDKIIEIEKIIKDIITPLNDLITTIDTDPKFKPLDTPHLLEYLCQYLKYFTCLSFLPLQFNGKKFRSEKEEEEEKEEKEEKEFLNAANSLLTVKISNFISTYEKLKNDGIDNQTNSLINVFAEKTGEDEPEKHQFKVNIILDLMFRMNFKHNKKLSIYARGKDNSFILVNIINKIYKADPDLWHDCLVDIASVTKHVLHDIISSQLTFLIQYIYIDFHKLKDLSDDREALSTGLSVRNKFLIIIEFLRLFCENHHKIYQTILIHSNINKFLLKNLEESLDLLDFVLKIPTLSKNSIKYLNSKANFASIFKKTQITNYFDELIMGITDFLIEVIQGCFESNMKYFKLPSNGSFDSKKDGDKNEESAKEKEETEMLKKGNVMSSIKSQKDVEKKNEEDEGNKDFEKYIETGYYCLDDLKNENDKLCLAQFLRFLNCFLEEAFNPKENKETIIKMLNPKKMLTGLAECTVELYKENKDFLNKNKENNEENNEFPKKEENNDEIPEKFSEDLVNLYLTSNKLNENLNYIISSNIFRFLLISSQYKSAEKARRYLKNLKTECEEDKPIKVKKNKNEVIGRREAYRFFSKIVKDVEIFYKPKEALTEQERKKFREFFTLEQYKMTEENFQKLFDLKGDVQKVVFFINPASLFTLESDLDNFIETSPGDKNERLDFLLNYMTTFEDNLSIRRKLWKKRNNLLDSLYNINYSLAIFASTFLTLFINIIVLYSSFYINKNEIQEQDFNTPRTLLEENYALESGTGISEYNYINYHDIYDRMKNRTNIVYSMQSFLEEPGEKFTDDPDNQITEDTNENTEEEEEDNGLDLEEEKEVPIWVRQELNTQFIVFLTIINTIFIIFLMANWFYFEFLKHEKEEEEEPDKKDEENDEEEADINIGEGKNKEEETFSILDIFKKFIYSDVQILIWNLLLGVIAIISVDFHFLYSIQLFTFFYLVKSLYTLIYSVQIRYDQFGSIFFMIILGSLLFSMIKFKWLTGEDSCKSYSECFFDMLNSGVRGGSGMGFGIKKINQPGFYSEFILEMFIFILVMLVLMNMITGIIVDSFQKLREKKNEENELKENTCYICSLHREKFEKRGIKFENHTEQEHNVVNYFNYIFKVKTTDESDLNSLDYQVMQSYKNRRTDFFPINTCLSLIPNKK